MKVQKKRCLIVEPDGRPCRRAHVAKGFCSLHYQRAQPREDGSLPTTEEIAGVARPPVRRRHVGGRVDDETHARLTRGVQLGIATSIHDLISKLAADFDPEAWVKKHRGAA